MNIVLLGSDRRASAGSGGRSDSIMLVHVDPKKGFLSVLSIPRDLRVTIPGRGPQRINTAYVYGGPALVIRTIQSALGVDLDHYIEIDFNAFRPSPTPSGRVCRHRSAL
jgi:LCP family protein required for cell wall assembly